MAISSAVADVGLPGLEEFTDPVTLGTLTGPLGYGQATWQQFVIPAAGIVRVLPEDIQRAIVVVLANIAGNVVYIRNDALPSLQGFQLTPGNGQILLKYVDYLTIVTDEIWCEHIPGGTIQVVSVRKL